MSQRIFASLDPFIEPGPILGRRVANQGFMGSLLAADPFDEYHFFPPNTGDAKALLDYAAEAHPAVAGRLQVFPRLELPRRLAETRYHCFHLSDCIANLAYLARLRNRFSADLFPVTGPTHSLSYASYAQAFLRHIWPGACARDGIIATSTAGQAVVRDIFAGLRQGLGLHDMPEPLVARIPLGVDTAELVLPDPQARATARQSLDLGEDQVAILVLGRVQHHSKMDLVPLFRAFQRLFADGLPREDVRLVVAGWADEDDDFPNTLRVLAANLGLQLTLELRPDNDRKLELLAAADVFCSPSDNPQETFGLTLLEAGACGLPVVASDYDGYRDLIAHGETGLLVPTMGAANTRDIDAFAPLVFDNQSHLLLAQRTAVSVPALAESLGRLIAGPELRQTMGRAARQRVETHFSWPGVIQSHLELWEKMWQSPVDEKIVREAVHPLHMNYAQAFASYPSRTLGQGVRLSLSRAGQAVYRGQDHPLIYAGVDELVNQEALRKLLFLARKPRDAADLHAQLVAGPPGLSPENAEFLILWAMKHDILETTDWEPKTSR